MLKPSRSGPTVFSGASTTSRAQTGYHLTSYSVFENFISSSTDENVDVSGIFTRECFEMWLQSRRGNIQHPEHSFQRALYAHIRGADGRKPFPEHIENAILKKLRSWTDKETLDQAKENPWDQIFGVNELNLGLKGFRSLGYHEMRHQSKDVGKIIKKRTRKKKTPKQSAIRVKAPKRRLAADKIELPVPDANVKDDLVKPSFTIPVTETRLHKFGWGDSPWHAFLAAMEAYLDAKSRKGFLKAALRRGVPLNSPSLIFLLSTPPSPEDTRFHWDFLMPPLEQRIFSTDREVGMIEYNPEWVCVSENGAAISLFGASSIGQHVFEKNYSVLNSLYCNIRFIPEYYGNGEAWCRIIMNKAPGSVGIFLMRCKLMENKNCLCHLQEQTDMFLDIAATTFFI